MNHHPTPNGGLYYYRHGIFVPLLNFEVNSKTTSSDEEISIENERHAFSRLQKAHSYIYGNELPSMSELNELDEAYVEWCRAKATMQNIADEIKSDARL